MAKPSKPQVSETIQVNVHNAGFLANRVRFLVYGESGVGKTRFACGFPNPLVLDIDDGLASVDWEVESVSIQSWDELLEVCNWLADMEEIPYDTIILDSLNEAQAKGLKATVQNYPTVRRAYDSLASQSDYGKMLNDLDDVVRFLKSLPVNVVFIAQVGGKDYDTDIIQPQLIGKNTARNICRMMDVVGYLYRQEDETLCIGFNLSEYVSKDRSGKLPPTIENPTYETISRYWRIKK